MALEEQAVRHRVDVGQRPVRVVRRQVPAPDRFEQGERRLRPDLGPGDLGGALGGLPGGVAEDVGGAGDDLQIPGRAAVLGEPPLDVPVEGAGLLRFVVPAEDDLGIRGGELAALVGLSRLDDHRVPLRAAGRVEPPGDVEVPAPVRERAHPGPDELPGVRVRPDVARRPAVPQLACGAQELGGAGVAVGLVQVAAAPEVLAGERVEAGHHVPGGAALAQVVQRREPPGHLVRLVEGGVDRRRQPEAVGDGGEGAEHGQRLGPADHVEVVDAALVLAQPQALGEEEEVELAAFGGLREPDERVQVDLAPRAGVGPDGVVLDAGELCGEVYLLHGHGAGASCGSGITGCDRSAGGGPVWWSHKPFHELFTTRRGSANGP